MPADSAGFEVHPAPMAVTPLVIAMAESRCVLALDRHHLLLGDEMGFAQRVARPRPGYESVQVVTAASLPGSCKRAAHRQSPAGSSSG
jgi:hypothetical protein